MCTAIWQISSMNEQPSNHRTLERLEGYSIYDRSAPIRPIGSFRDSCVQTADPDG